MNNLSVKFDDNFIYVNPPTGFTNYMKEQFNAVKVKKGYKIPKNLYSMRELLLAFKELMNHQEFLDQGQILRKARDTALQAKMQEDETGDDRLRPYQRVDVQYLSQLPAAGIFNEQRTGKTPTSILLMKQLGTDCNLIICPASLIWNWEKEMDKWFYGCRPFVVSGTPQKREEIYNNFEFMSQAERCVLIVSKDTWKRDCEQFKNYEFDTVFVDEAHFLRNYKSAQSKAIYQIKAKRRYALTGTPAVKHAADAYGILHFLYPDKFKSYWQFAERYFEIGEDFMGHKEIGQLKKHRQAEFQELIALLSVQRKRKDVMKWLPEKQYQVIPVRMTDKQAKLYERMKDEFMAYLEDIDHTVDTPNILSQLMRLQQLCIDPRLVGFENVDSAKTQALLEWVENNNEPVVIMSKFTSYLKLLKEDIQKLGLSVGEINGTLSNEAKNQNAMGFQSGRHNILLCNIQSAGTGFTLDRAESIIFVDSEWNPAINQQAEDRITPISEDHNHKINVIKIVADDSVDSRIEDVLEFKQAITDYVNNGGSDVLKRLLG